MVKFLTIIFLILSSQCELHSQDYWITQASPTTKNLRTCFFTDTLNGWIGGDSGLIIHTTNKGQSWTFQNSGVTFGIVSMSFINESVGYALSWEADPTPPNYYGTRILYTSNGGNNWGNYLFRDTNLFLNTIYFLDSLNGYMAGTEGKIFYTSNSGINWTLSVIDSGAVFGFPVRGIKFYNSQIGYCVGGVFDVAGVIYKTINGGRNWYATIVGPEPVNDLYIFDSVSAIGVGGDFEYGSSKVRTTDGGLFWDYYEFGFFGIANSIGFRTDNEAWSSLGIVDSFLVSTNAGANWRLTGAPNGAKIYKLIFINYRNGWAVGDNGVILKYNSNLINISENNFSIPVAFKLYQNYPNPFNPSTSIRYSLNENRFVIFKIYDVLGNEVRTLVNERQNAGSYEINFYGVDLASGVYFYKIESEGFSDMKRMILLK